MEGKWIAGIAAAGWYGLIQKSISGLDGKTPEVLIPLNGETILERLVRQLKKAGAMEVFAGVGAQNSLAGDWEKYLLKIDRECQITIGGTPWTAERWEYMKTLPCKLVPMDDWQHHCSMDTLTGILQAMENSDLDFDQIFMTVGDYVFTKEALNNLLNLPVPSVFFIDKVERCYLLSKKFIPAFIKLAKRFNKHEHWGYPFNNEEDKNEWGKEGFQFLAHDYKTKGTYPGWFEVAAEHPGSYEEVKKLVESENKEKN